MKLKNIIYFIFLYLTNSRLRMDLKSFEIARKAYVFHAWNLCKKMEIITLLNTPRTIDFISTTLSIKNKKMLEAILDFLVGNKVLLYQKRTYLFNQEPIKPTEAELSFVNKNYTGAEKWSYYLYEHSEQALHKGKTKKSTGFDEEYMLDLWDSVMEGSFYSLRKIAIKKLLANSKENAKIIDLGCGSGIALINMLEEANKPVQLIGIDSSKKTLKRCENKIKKFNKTSNELQKNNAKKIKLYQKSVLDFKEKMNSALVSLVLHHIPLNERKNFIDSIYNSLEDNGKLVVFQLVNKNKFERIFSDWLLYVVPSHQGLPFHKEYISLFNKFSKVEIMLNGLIIIAEK